MTIIVWELFSVNQINDQYFNFCVLWLLSWVNYKNATFNAYYKYSNTSILYHSILLIIEFR